MNTDTVLKYNLDIIESGNAIQLNINLKCDVFQKNHSLVNGNNESVCATEGRKHFSCAKQLLGGGTIQQNMNAILTDITDLESEKAKIMNFDLTAIFYNSSDDATKKLKETKRTMCNSQDLHSSWCRPD